MNRFTLLLLGLVSLVITGCVASGPTGFKTLPAKPGAGQIYVFRESKFEAAGVIAEIYVDGSKIGDLPNGSFLVVYAPTGKHRVEARFSLINRMWYKDAAIEVTTSEGQSTFSGLNLTMTSLTVGSFSNSTWQTGFEKAPEPKSRNLIETLRINNSDFDVLSSSQNRLDK